MMRMSLLAATAMLAPLAASAQPAAPAPLTGPVQPLEYAVKFVCGRTSSAAARPQAATGNYYTMINVHNPGRRIEVTHKVALAQVIGQPAHMTSFSTIGLRYDEAVDLDCPWIARQLAAAGIPTPGMFTGFVVLQTRTELDVVAVYTAAPTTTNQVSTMHTERVPVRHVM